MQEQHESMSYDDDDDDRTQDIIRQSLAHVQIFRPTSLASLVTTLEALPAYLLGPSIASHHPEYSSFTTHIAPISSLAYTNASLTTYTHRSHSRAISLLILDSASAFFWPTRMAAESASASATTPGTDATSPTPQDLQHLLSRLLHTTQLLLRSTLIYTPWTLSPQAPALLAQQIRATGGASHPTTTSTPFPNAATMFLRGSNALGPVLRIMLRRKEVVKFPIGMSLEKATRDREMRQGVVERGVFEGWVVGGGAVGSGFEFSVTKEGVVVEGGEEEGGGVEEREGA